MARRAFDLPVCLNRRVEAAPISHQYTWAETGFVGQNVYLYCASEDLATVVRGGIDRAKLAPPIKLRPEQKITLDQPVGYPKK